MRLKIEELFREGTVTGVSFDSRKVKAGDAFFAITGDSFDGNEYIDDAFKNGASFVFADNPSKKGKNIEYFADIRMGLAIAAGIVTWPPAPCAVCGDASEVVGEATKPIGNRLRAISP